jgi:hypothetical protein
MHGQDLAHTRAVIGKLCSEQMHGRGYVKNGDQRAARYIRREWKKDGIRPLGTGFYQFFRIDANTFPGSVNIEINGRTLIPGCDYLIDPSSPGLSGSFVPITINLPGKPGIGEDQKLVSALGRLVLIDTRENVPVKETDKTSRNEWIRNLCLTNPYGLAALVEISDEKLTFGASSQLSAIPHIIMNIPIHSDSISSVRINFRNRYLSEYKTRNIVGYVPGTECPDSFLVFTAHYDHLGVLGKDVYFPGANDNASGVAMLLRLSQYFSRHPQRFSVAFISFSGEEEGLRGSGYFCRNPMFPLSSVKFLINLDIVGTGSDGIMVVNATEFQGQFARLASLNESGRFVPDILKRGKACNSDHCPFYVKGVPCFFIYTLGGIAAYHDPYDRPETLPLSAFDGLTKLLIGFTGRM